MPPLLETTSKVKTPTDIRAETLWGLRGSEETRLERARCWLQPYARLGCLRPRTNKNDISGLRVLQCDGPTSQMHSRPSVSLGRLAVTVAVLAHPLTQSPLSGSRVPSRANWPQLYLCPHGLEQWRTAAPPPPPRPAACQRQPSQNPAAVSAPQHPPASAPNSKSVPKAKTGQDFRSKLAHPNPWQFLLNPKP